jgi:exodeoxyribonuclease VII small subunit
MEDDFFPDFLEVEEKEENTPVIQPKKEKKPSSNKKEKALTENDNDSFELFSQGDATSNEELLNEEIVSSALVEESSSTAVIKETSQETVEIPTVSTTEATTVVEVPVEEATVVEDTTVNKNTPLEEDSNINNINTQKLIEKEEETIMPIVPQAQEFPNQNTATIEEKTTSVPSAEPQVELSFEAALTQLELIVNKMETGNFKLEELLAAYEKGNSLAKICKDKLEKMERKVELLTKDNGSSGEWTPFDASNHR